MVGDRRSGQSAVFSLHADTLAGANMKEKRRVRGVGVGGQTMERRG